MLRTIVIDDEKLSREVICNYLKLYCPDIKIVATASSVKTAYKAIRKYGPDFIFLDIEMADGKGFDLINMFDKLDFKVIFVTAYSEYAVKAFRFSAVDYLLKPVRIDELISAVEKIKTMSEQGPGTGFISLLIKNLNSRSETPQTLVIPHSKGFDVLKIPEIIMCQADGYCTNIYLDGNRKVVSSKNLKHFNDLLLDYGFIRIHNSYLISINHVTGYNRQGEVFLTGGSKAFLGDSYKAEFTRKFNKK
jgi:two-component system LytT family response regulator